MDSSATITAQQQVSWNLSGVEELLRICNGRGVYDHEVVQLEGIVKDILNALWSRATSAKLAGLSEIKVTLGKRTTTSNISYKQLIELAMNILKTRGVASETTFNKDNTVAFRLFWDPTQSFQLSSASD